MKKIGTWVLIVIAAVACTAGGVFFYVQKNRLDAQGVALMAPVSVPTGWYVHRINAQNIILTQSETLPNIRGEGYAYGDQIDIERSVGALTPEVWLLQHGVNINDVLINFKQWTTLRGWRVLYTWHKTEAEPELSAYFFKDNVVYVISLYPYHKADGVTSPDPRLAAFEYVIEQYIPA